VRSRCFGGRGNFGCFYVLFWHPAGTTGEELLSLGLYSLLPPNPTCLVLEGEERDKAPKDAEVFLGVRRPGPEDAARKPELARLEKKQFRAAVGPHA
jgi:hypothetical protein